MSAIESLLHEHLSKARGEVRKRSPYFMHTLMSFIPVNTPGLGTLGVSRGLVLSIDGEWATALPVEELAACLVHEGMHILNKHLERGEAFSDHALGNIAMDLAINVMIRSAGWILPHGLYPEDYGFPDNLLAEEYYALLLQRRANQNQAQQNAQQQPGSTKQKDGQGSGGPVGGGKPGQEKKKAKGGDGGKGDQKPSNGGSPGGSAGDQQQNAGQPPSSGGGSSGSAPSDLPDGKQSGVGSGHCGGVAGTPHAHEEAADAADGRADVERKQIAKQTLMDIKNHVAQHGRGSVPNELQQMLDLDDGKNEVRWEDKLAHFIKKASSKIESGGMDFSLARPSKRSYARGFPRPGMVQHIPEVAFILDTSGSMGTDQIKGALHEMVGIFKAMGIDRAWLIQADSRLAEKPRKIRVKDIKKHFKIKGRGGTSFDPGLQALETLRPRPELAIYLTDGDGSVSFKPKGIEVVWCVVRGHYNRKPPCDWGHTVIIAEKDARR